MKLKNQTIDLGLSGYDELFMTQQERGFRTLDYYKQLRRQSFS